MTIYIYIKKKYHGAEGQKKSNILICVLRVSGGSDVGRRSAEVSELMTSSALALIPLFSLLKPDKSQLLEVRRTPHHPLQQVAGRRSWNVSAAAADLHTLLMMRKMRSAMLLLSFITIMIMIICTYESITP